jgi:RimJ/RimL family protein N-acetyltransferase
MAAELFNQSGSETLGFKKARMLVGSAVIWDLDLDTRRNIADKIHVRLVGEQSRMRVIDQKKLLESMENGRFVIRLGENNELLGCAQYWPMPANSTVMEVGTWLSFPHPDYENGSGAAVMKDAAQLAAAQPETAMTIALVHEGNEKAQEALKRIGGVDIGWRYSDYVAINDVPARMRVFNLINLTEEQL